MNKKEVKDDPIQSEGPISTRAEKKQVEERLAIGPHVVYETIRREGEEELQRTPSSLAWSALAAGLSMGFSFTAEGLLTAHLPDQPWRPLISRFGYSVGFDRDPWTAAAVYRKYGDRSVAAPDTKRPEHY